MDRKLTRADFLRLLATSWAAGGYLRCGGDSDGGGEQPVSEVSLRQYPGITHDEIAEAWPGFEEAEPPRLDEDAEVIEAAFSDLPSVVAANPGQQVRVTGSDPDAIVSLRDCTDVEILIPDQVTVGQIRVDGGCLRLRVRGEGTNGRIDSLRIADSAHVTAHSLMLRGVQEAAINVRGVTGPVAYVSCIVGAADPVFINGLLSDGPSDVLIANCNMGAVRQGRDDWCLRFGEISRVVMVDCFCESRGSQQVLRRASGASQFLFKRVTTFNAVNGSSFADVGTSSSGYVLRDCYLYDCVSYIGGSDGYGFGGYNRGAEDYSAIWRVYDHTFYSFDSNPVTDEGLADREENAFNPGDWQYRLGSPSYNSWDGSHPGWPERISFSGAPMAVRDPYAI